MMTPGESAAMSAFLRPFILLGLLTALAYGRTFLLKYLPRGRLKKVLLKEV